MMELNERTVDNCTIIAVAGDAILSADINRLGKRILSVFRKQNQIILDLSELELIGTQGVRMLIDVWKEIYSAQGLLILACIQPATRIAFTINKAYVFVETCTVAEALEKIRC